jgi:hypothetical protein
MKTLLSVTYVNVIGWLGVQIFYSNPSSYAAIVAFINQVWKGPI